MSINSKILFLGTSILVALSFGSFSRAHNGEDHGQSEGEGSKAAPSAPGEEQILATINEAYLNQVKPIFQKSCTDCHSVNSNPPWYYAIPGAKQLMDYDMTESKIHLDMSNDFPFAGHGTPLEDLGAIQKVIEKDQMPPLRYRLLHWSSKITPDELKVIKTWIEFGKEELKKIKKEKE